MNYEINSEQFNTKTLSGKSDIKSLLILTSSVLLIPVAYVFITIVFVLQFGKGNINLKSKNTTFRLIIVYVFIGVLFSQYKLISFAYGLMILLCLYSYCLFSSSSNSWNLSITKKIIYTISIIVFLIGIFQYLNPQFAMPSKWVDKGEYQLHKRIYSTFFNPNIFGFYINFIIIIVCENLDLKKFNIEWIVFTSGVLCLFLTFSRAAWISLIISLLIVSIFNIKYLKFAVIISITIFGMDKILGIGRMDPVRAAEDSSLLYRFEIWKACIRIIKNKFFTGIGFGTLFKHISQYSDVVKPNIEHCHNLYLQIFTETGITGFSIFVIFLYKTVTTLWSKIRGYKNNQIWITSLLVLIMTMIHGMVDSVFFTPQILMILSIYAGTLSVSNK